MFKKAASEIVNLRRDDFARLLKASLQKQRDEIAKAISQITYFLSWPEETVIECSILSDLKTYDPENIILGEGIGKPSSVHFVLKGSCSMIQKLVVKKFGRSLKLVKDQTTTNLTRNMKYVIAQVCVYSEGACFSLGENFDMRTVVSDAETSILRIPLYVLRQHNTANIWSRIRNFLDARLPSTQEVFQKCVEQRQYAEYRKQLFDQLLTRKIPNPTTIQDVPYCWRAENSRDEGFGCVGEGPFRKHS